MVDFSSYKDLRVLVTGHTGFKGSWLTATLIRLGAHVIGYSLEPQTIPNLFDILNLREKITHYVGDICDYDGFKKVIDKEKPDLVFHLAAQAIVREGYARPLETFQVNTLGTANILDAIKSSTARAAVFVTTDKVYENIETQKPYTELDPLGGHDPYSASKAAAELIISSYQRSYFDLPSSNLLIASARAGNVVGGGDWSQYRLVPDIIKAVFEGDGVIVIRNPDHIRPWQHVLDVITGYLLLGKALLEKRPQISGAWNFAPGTNCCITVEQLVKKALTIFNQGTFRLEKSSEHEHRHLLLDASKSKNKLGWISRYQIEKTLNLTFQWYKSYYAGESMVEFTRQQIDAYFSGL